MKTYKTVLGDTLDMVSYKMYGSGNYTNELFNANPHLQEFYSFSANIEMNIPDVDVAIVEELPPWERPDINSEVENKTELEEIYLQYWG